MAGTGPFDEFDPRVREDVDGLIWLGQLEDTIHFCGHTFVIRTLKGDDELYAGLVVKDFAETFGQARAYAWAKVALSLVSIDGRDDFCPPIGPDRTANAHARFRWITENWYWPVAEFIYGRLVGLETRQLAAIEAVQSLSEGSLPNYTPYADSSTEQGDSPETPQEET